MKHSNSTAEILHELGYRLTPQRLAILSAVEEAENHISADDIYTQVGARYPHMNISTVYRTLELLKGLGLVTETDLGEGRVRYHAAGKGHHHHLVCQKCGAIADLDESLLAPLRSALLEKYGFHANLRHLAILGCCVNCSK